MCSNIALACAVAAIISLVACGGGSSETTSNPSAPTAPSNPIPPAPSTVTASGVNWSFRTDGFSGVGITAALGEGGPLTALEGSFNPSGTAAVFESFGSCFRPSDERARFTGTRSGNTVQLQSQQVNGQVIQLTGTVSAAGDQFEGMYSITGGCGSGASGRMIGRPVNLSGVWVGTMGGLATVFDLQMASTPDGDANYVLSGTAKFSNSQCFPNAVIMRRARGRVLFPDVVSEPQRLELIAEVTEDLSTMHIVFVLVNGRCPELSSGDGRLVRQ
jgi:hypothetical protein